MDSRTSDDRGRSQLSEAAIEGLRGASSELAVGAGEAVVRQGEVGTAFFVLLAGAVEIRLQGEDGRVLPLTRLAPGATFGEMALLRNEPVSADVVAVEEATLMVCPAAGFKEALAKCEPLRTELMARLAEDLHNTTAEAWNFFQKADALRLLIRCENRPGPVVEESGTMRSAMRSLDRLSQSSQPVLFLGEPGTGKLFAARTLHARTHGAEAPLIIVDCRRVRSADAGKLLLGSDVEGDGCRTRPGAFQLARGGTLILRHVEALGPETQERLARTIASDGDPTAARLVATMRHDPGAAAPDNGLDSALGVILGAHAISMPPLRDRRRDIAGLAEVFLDEVAPNGRHLFTVEAERALVTLEFDHHHARQLRETVEVATLCAEGKEIRAEHLFSGAATEKGPSGLDLRRLLRRSRLFRAGPLGLARGAACVGYGIVIAACLLAAPTRPGWAANRLIWGVWEPAVFALFLLLGSVWCSVCPLSTAGRLVQKVFSLGRTPPAWLKRNGAGVAAVGFFFIIALEMIFNMGERPQASGLLLLGLVFASVAFCAVYSREVWCRHVCPLGALASGLAPAAPLEVGARPGLCSSTCTTHDCYKGSASVPGCTVFHHPLNAAESHHCKLCFDCFKSCPHESTRIYLRPPVVGVWRLSGASAGLAPFAVAVFIFTLVLLAAEGSPRLAAPISLFGAGLAALLFGLGLHHVLPRMLLASGGEGIVEQGRSPVAVQASFGLLVLGWGPLMAYQITNLPSVGSLRLAAAPESLWAQLVPSAGLSVESLLQGGVILFAAVLTAILLGGIVFFARRRAVDLVPAGWAALVLGCVGYVAAALYLVS